MARDIVMGIDIGTSVVKTVIAERQEDSITPRILGYGASPAHGLRRGFIVDQNDVALAVKNSVNKAHKNIDSRIRRAYVAIEGIGIDGIRSKGSIVASRADNEITENDLKRAVSQCETQLGRSSSSYLLNREIVHSFPLIHKVDEEVVTGSPVGMKGEKLEVEALFITSPVQHFNNLIKTMDIAGITIEDIIAAPLANSHILLNKKEREVGCLLVNIGGDTSSMMVFEEGTPVSIEVFPIGSNHITYDIARGFQILLDEAERLKLSYDVDASMKRKLTSIIEPRLNDIFELIGGHLNKIQRTGLLPAGIILTGGGANLSNVESVAKKTLTLPSQLSQAKLSGCYNDPLIDPSWSVALGLCSSALNEGDSTMSCSGGISGFGTKTKKMLVRWFKNFLP
ncbi:cell division protein FtsA [Patescibacteria group bacterium]